jgi:hypothetical protein
MSVILFLQHRENMKWMRLWISKPLGRWSQCGDKKTVVDVLELKIRQKAHRESMIKSGTDPYRASTPSTPLDKAAEEYMLPFVTQW